MWKVEEKPKQGCFYCLKLCNSAFFFNASWRRCFKIFLCSMFLLGLLGIFDSFASVFLSHSLSVYMCVC